MLISSQNLAKSMVYTNSLIRLLLIAIFSLFASASYAGMYKWVDGDGNTHYTQSPPPGDIKGKSIKPPPKVDPEHSRNQLKARQDLLESNRKQRQETAEKAGKEKTETAAGLAACEKAKAILASFQRPRVNEVDSEGNRVRISEEKRQTNIANAQKKVGESCKK